MPIPKYDEMYNALLEALSDGKVEPACQAKLKKYKLTNKY